MLPFLLITFSWLYIENVSGYICNHGSLSGERDTAYPRGRYGECRQRDFLNFEFHSKGEH